MVALSSVMRFSTSLLFALALAASPAGAVPQPPPFAHTKSDLPVDADLRWGTMDNGVRYAVLRHAEPPGRLSMRLHIDAGSLNERENQRGLAHFLEHMAFNGTKNFKPDDLVEVLQNAGIAFGADLNAYTSFDETVYMLDLPKNDAATVDKCFTVLRDWADGMSLLPDQIDKERGVILSEKRDRDSVEMRLMEEQFNVLLPKALVSKRFPIGTEEVISKAPRERFVEFYQGHYSPDRTSVIVVGDFDADAMVAKVKAMFGSMKPLAERKAEPDLGEVVPTGLQFKVFQDNEVKATELSITCAKALKHEQDTKASRTKDMRLAIANAMINRRLEILSKQEGSPILKGSTNAFEFIDFVTLNNLEVVVVDGRWQDALGLAEQSLRRALEHGFTASELKEATAKLLRDYEEAVKTKATRKSSEIAMDIVNSLNDHEVFTSPETDLAWFQDALPLLTVAACHKALCDAWSGDNRFVSITSAKSIDDAPAAMAKAWEKSIATKVTAPAEEGDGKFAYDKVGTPGTIVKRAEIKDLGITQWTLSNGIKVNFKPTDFEKNTIHLLGRFGSGKLSLAKDSGGLDMFASAVFNAGGLEAHSNDELERLFAGKKVGVAFDVGDDAFTLSGSTTREDLGAALTMFCARLQHPGYRVEAERQFRNALPILGMQITMTPEGVFGTRGQRLLMSGDQRFGLDGIKELARHNTAEVKAWLAPALKDAAMEFSVVGDFDPRALEPLLLQTLGALPSRQTTRPDDSAARVVDIVDAGAHRLEYESKVPKALNLVFWPTADRSDIKRTRRLNVLAEVLGDRLRVKIREEMGEAYSPGAGAQASDTWKDYGFIMCYSPGDPSKSTEVIRHIVAIAAELAEKGVTDEELGRALKPILTNIEQQRRSNEYWLETVLAACQEKPEMLDWSREMESDFKGITTGDISALAKQYLVPDRVRSLNVTTVR